MVKLRVKFVSVLLAALTAFSLSACSMEKNGNFSLRPSPVRGETVTVEKSEIRDRVLGAWVGSAIGLGSGYEYVTTLNNTAPVDGTVVNGTVAYVALADKYWEPNGQVCSGSIGVNELGVGPVNDPRVEQNKVLSDDDMHVDVLNQFIFRDYGPDLGATDIAAAWDYYGVNDVGGGETVRDTIRNNGYMPPFTGQRAFGNFGYWVTESWIENETLGLLFPYMTESAEAYGELFASVQGDALAMYLGELCVLIQALAYECDDTAEILEKAFDRMDKNNDIYEIYKYVKASYQAGMPWRETCVGVVKNRVNCKMIKIADEAGFSINANAGMIFIGLLYGENDFEESVKITSLCGLDGDCTAATVGGILGAMVGYDKIPEKYTDFVGKDTLYYNYTGKNGDEAGVNWGAFAYCGENFPNSLSFNALTDMTVKNIEAQILARGGSIDADAYNIARQTLTAADQTALTNYGFEDGDTKGWTFEGNEASSLSATESKAHLGDYGGMILTDEVRAEAKAYQSVTLVPGHRYKASVWMNGCDDREVRLFAAGSETVYRGYTNPLSSTGAHAKIELYFTADAASYKVGVELPKAGEDAFSTTLYFDDLSVEDITKSSDFGYGQTYEAEDSYLSSGAKVEKNKAASGGKAVVLGGDEGVRLNYGGLKNGFMTVRIYYGNLTGQVALLSVLSDEKNVGTVPLVAQGEANYNEGNFVQFTLYAGEGTHSLKLVLKSFDDITIDRVSISAGHASFN